MVRHILRRAALATLLLFVGSSAYANDAQKARADYEKGSRYFEAEEYEAALPYFQSAYSLSGKRPSSIFGLAQCERSLKMYEEAIKHFREYLATNPKDATSVKETIELLVELKARKDQEKHAQAQKEALENQRRQQEQTAEENRARVEREAAIQAAIEKERQAKVFQPQIPAAPTSEPPKKQDPSIFSSPWFWVAAGAVAVGGAIAVGALASGADGAEYGGTQGVLLQPLIRR